MTSEVKRGHARGRHAKTHGKTQFLGSNHRTKTAQQTRITGGRDPQIQPPRPLEVDAAN